ncbi:MAG TPA: hypothetical protein VE338_00720 [Ktedonobacterales bacterium]|jgi:cation:H+ antiporter|nr:hypothetical protein [Ktedonobacterales bacterium]
MPAAWLAVVLFVVGVALAIWATEFFLDGIVNLATGLRLSAFVIGAVLSGLEVENVAVGLAAGAGHVAPVALGTVYGGATFLVCVALGLGAIIAPLETRLPHGFLILFAVAPVVAGLGVLPPAPPRWIGGALLLAFVGAMGYVVITARRKDFLLASQEVAEAQTKRYPLALAVVLTLLGLIVLSVAGEMVAHGAEGIISALGVPALLMGMVVAPAAIELEEVARQAIPALRGRSDVSAGNLVGTLLYFLLFNLGLIILLTPVRVTARMLTLDWPALVLVTWVATVFLWRGRVGRGAGFTLLGLYVIYIAAHIVLT